MTEDVTTMNMIDTVTLVEGYDAMRIFLGRVSLRLGSSDEEIAFIVGSLKWADGAPVDPAMWQDWLTAVGIARGGRGGATEPPNGSYSADSPS